MRIPSATLRATRRGASDHPRALLGLFTVMTAALAAGLLCANLAWAAQSSTPSPSQAPTPTQATSPSQVPADQVPGNDLQALGDAGSANPRSIAAQSVEVQTIFAMTNAERIKHGLKAFEWSPELAAAARTHAQLMVNSNELSHRYTGEPDLSARAARAGAHFSMVAENIAQGSSVGMIEQEWMQSAPHRANILDSNANALGVAVASSGGLLYAVEDFAMGSKVLTIPEVEEKVEAQLAAFGVHQVPKDSPLGTPEKLKDDVRRNCPLDVGTYNETAGGFILRWEGPSLTLPQALTTTLLSHEFSFGAVGACEPDTESRGFTNYRVAVQLF